MQPPSRRAPGGCNVTCVCQPYVVRLMQDRPHHSAGTARQQQIRKATKPVARVGRAGLSALCWGRCGPACANASRPSQFRRVSEACLLSTLPGARLRGLAPRAASQKRNRRGEIRPAAPAGGATGVAENPRATPEGKPLSTLALRDDDGSLGRVAFDPGASTTASDRAAHHAVPASSRRALDWFVFFLADVQTGFGPFIAVYLTTHAWTQVDIGLVLSVAGLVALAGQMPGGALVDAARSARWAAALAVAAIGVSALALALWPVFAIVMASRVLHASASCLLGPAIAAISLGLVGHAALGERIGRNVRFASIGAGLSAIAMGASGHFMSSQAVFFITAAL